MGGYLFLYPGSINRIRVFGIATFPVPHDTTRGRPRLRSQSCELGGLFPEPPPRSGLPIAPADVTHDRDRPYAGPFALPSGWSCPTDGCSSPAKLRDFARCSAFPLR